MEENPYDIAELLIQYLSDELPPDERARVSQMLERDASLRKLLKHYQDMTATRQHLRYMQGLDREHAWQQVLKKRNAKRTRPNMARHWVRYAAAVLLLVSATVWWYWPEPQHERIVPDAVYGHHNDVLPGSPKAELVLSDGQKIWLGEQPVDVVEKDGTVLFGQDGELQYTSGVPRGMATTPMNTLRVPEAGTYRVILPDGTTVWLNALSELQFPVRFAGNTRQVTLKGEAFFDVAHDPDKPFTVLSNDHEINVLGTEFNVSAYQSVATTTLVSGQVRVGNNSGQSVTLRPGQQTHVAGKNLVARPADLEKAIAWKNGYFRFNQDPIESVMQELARWYGVDVSYEGRIPNEQYGGSIDRKVKLGEVLEMFKDISGLSFEINGMAVVVKGI